MPVSILCTRASSFLPPSWGRTSGGRYYNIHVYAGRYLSSHKHAVGNTTSPADRWRDPQLSGHAPGVELVGSRSRRWCRRLLASFKRRPVRMDGASFNKDTIPSSVFRARCVLGRTGYTYNSRKFRVKPRPVRMLKIRENNAHAPQQKRGGTTVHPNHTLSRLPVFI